MTPPDVFTGWHEVREGGGAVSYHLLITYRDTVIARTFQAETSSGPQWCYLFSMPRSPPVSGSHPDPQYVADLLQRLVDERAGDLLADDAAALLADLADMHDED